MVVSDGGIIRSLWMTSKFSIAYDSFIFKELLQHFKVYIYVYIKISLLRLSLKSFWRFPGKPTDLASCRRERDCNLWLVLIQPRQTQISTRVYTGRQGLISRTLVGIELQPLVGYLVMNRAFQKPGTFLDILSAWLSRLSKPFIKILVLTHMHTHFEIYVVIYPWSLGNRYLGVLILPLSYFWSHFSFQISI